MIVVIFLFSTIRIQAQTTQTKLNQIELMKQFLGTWKGETSKDTVITGHNTQFGTGLECVSQIAIKGKILDSVKQLLGYDKKYDKFILTELIKSSPVIEICASWFISKNAGEMEI